MCIIILNTKGLIPKTTLQACAINNPDGAGMMHAYKGKLETFKELKSFDLFYEYYSNVRKSFKGNIALHFRIKTHGTVSEKNIHPFFINRNLAFMHNGILDVEDYEKTELSDTQLFNERILKRLPKDFLRNKAIMELIETSIGYNKLLFLNNLNEYTIINEKAGLWREGNWYSNYSYLAETSFNFDDYECESCGKILFSDYEIEEGFCTECLSKYNQTCQNCDEILTSDYEIETGYCEECLNTWKEYLPKSYGVL